jgi:hypothetical protein
MALFWDAQYLGIQHLQIMTKSIALLLPLCFSFCSFGCSSGSSAPQTDATEPISAPVEETQSPREAPAFYIANLKRTYDPAPNPIIANFKGVFIGDYYHLTFEDNQGQQYDFGDAKNETSGFQLERNYEDTEGEMAYLEESGNEGNPELIGKSFRIYWEWKSNVFLCCEGEYEETEAEIPTIVKLELVK